MAVSTISAVKLAEVLQTSFNDGIVKSLSENVADWKNIKAYSTGKFDGKEYRFLIETGDGPASVQYLNANTNAFPTAQFGEMQEATVVAKEMAVTLQIRQNLWERAQESTARYAKPLINEIAGKHRALQRRLCADLYGDGTGVLGTVASGGLVETDIANGNIVLTMSAADTARGCVYHFAYGDLVLAKTPAAAAHSPSGGSGANFYAWQVVGLPNRAARSIALRAVDANGATCTGYAASNIVATDVLYRLQPSFPDVTSNSSIGDYGTCSDTFTGLESLSADDGRTVHALVMSGLLAGTRHSCGAAALDVSHLAALLDKLEIRNGGEFTYTQAIASHEALTALIDSRETDRRFMSVGDNKKGITGQFGYCRPNFTTIFKGSEFCRADRIMLIPEVSGRDKVLELKLSDFAAVKTPDGPTGWMLRPSSSGGHSRDLVSYLTGHLSLAANRPAAIGVLHNFT